MTSDLKQYRKKTRNYVNELKYQIKQYDERKED
jgi:hypothetical protein